MAIGTLLLVVTLASGQADLSEHNWTVDGASVGDKRHSLTVRVPTGVHTVCLDGKLCSQATVTQNAVTKVEKGGY